MKLLIIDDEAHIRLMMRLTLEAAGYEVDEATTGEEGLAGFGDGTGYAAILLRQKMPRRGRSECRLSFACGTFSGFSAL